MFQLLKYLLSTCNDNSRTWAVHVRHLAKMYGLPDPLVMLNGTPPSKESWKGDITTLITAHHEKQFRDAALTNSKMEWLNISLLGLQGKAHPMFHGVSTADQVKKLYPVLKMLAGDYLTYDLKSRQGGGGSPSCRLCNSPIENLQHVLSCPSTAEPRLRIQHELKSLLCDTNHNHLQTLSENQFHGLATDEKTFTQFCVDCTSFNLPEVYRISINDARLTEIFKITRDLCFSVHSDRLRQLKAKQ